MTELKTKGSIPDADMRIFMSILHRKGTPGEYLGLAPQQGIHDVIKSQDTANTLAAKHRESLSAGFFLEAIASQVLLCELAIREWLQVWRRRDFSKKELLTFGKLLAEASAKGFDSSLIARLRAFNSLRNQAIHNLLSGKLTYDSLADAFDRDPSLIEDTEAWVSSRRPKIGEVQFGSNGEIFDLQGNLLN